ncbi:glycoside hydrolase superfamily [Mycena crocata]|nr:glycoside hydrolase superfamily [Mycena crocata]
MHVSAISYCLLFLSAGSQLVVATPIPSSNSRGSTENISDSADSSSSSMALDSSDSLPTMTSEGVASSSSVAVSLDESSDSSSADQPLPSSFPGNAAQNSTSGVTAPDFFVYAIDANDQNPGPPPAADLTGFNVVALAFLLTDGAPAPYSQPDQWQKLSKSQRADIKSDYAAAGIKLIVSAFGATEKHTTNGADAKDTAVAMAKWVKDNDLDGIDVDFEDMDAMSAGEAEDWLIEFTSQLRTELGNALIITHAPVAGWQVTFELAAIFWTDAGGRFTPKRSDMPQGGYRKLHQAVGDKINWYNIQFYNSPKEDTTCDNLLHKSGEGGLPETSVFEINTKGQVPLEKIAIGKPATEQDAASGFMNATYLGTCVDEAAQKNRS